MYWGRERKSHRKPLVTDGLDTGYEKNLQEGYADIFVPKEGAPLQKCIMHVNIYSKYSFACRIT